MDANSRKLRRTQLDQQLLHHFNTEIPPTPRGGWIRAIRQALGMNYEVLGKRLGVSKQTAHQLEKAESSGSLTINRMRAAANALECDLAILLIPRQSLEKTILERATVVSTVEVMWIKHAMALEQQAISQDRIEQMIVDRASEKIERGDQEIWE